VLSEDLVLFLKLGTPCLELCRVTTSLRGTGDANGDYAPPASPRVVRTLALPIFHPDYRVHTEYMHMDGYCPRQCDPEVLQQQRQRPSRAPSPLTFHSTPEDIVVGIAFLLRLRGPCPSWKKAVTTISHHALFALAGTGTGTGRTTSWYDEEDGDAKRTRAKSRKGVWVCQWVRWRRRRLFYGKNGVLAQHVSGSSRHLHSTRQ
jgi:hypothetical protein